MKNQSTVIQLGFAPALNWSLHLILGRHTFLLPAVLYS